MVETVWLPIFAVSAPLIVAGLCVSTGLCVLRGALLATSAYVFDRFTRVKPSCSISRAWEAFCDWRRTPLTGACCEGLPKVPTVPFLVVECVFEEVLVIV